METYSNTTNDTAAALQAGQHVATAQQKVQALANSGTPFIVNNQGHVVTLEAFLDKPVRHKARPRFYDAHSFIAYLNIYKREHSLVMATSDVNGGEFVALLDIAGPGDTSWNDHSAKLELVAGEDWKQWVGGDGKAGVNKNWTKQEEFCLFVERQRHVFVNPRAADMLEIAQTLESNASATFKSGVRLKNGDRTLVAVTESTATAGRGEVKIEIPDEITVQMAPFKGGQPVEMKAFLRFRIVGEALCFQVELQRIDEIIRAAVDDTASQIKQETALPVLNGEL